MKREVLLLGNPALYEVSTAVTRGELEQLRPDIEDMFEFLQDAGFGHGLLVQGVELADPLDQGMAGIAGNGLQLVHHGGVGNEGGDAQLVADLPGDEAAQIAGVLTLDA